MTREELPVSHWQPGKDILPFLKPECKACHRNPHSDGSAEGRYGRRYVDCRHEGPWQYSIPFQVIVSRPGSDLLAVAWYAVDDGTLVYGEPRERIPRSVSLRGNASYSIATHCWMRVDLPPATAQQGES